MKKLFVLCLCLSSLFLIGCSNPSVPAGEVGYVTNEPLFFGEKGEFLDIVVGPSSYGFGWRNKIKHKRSYKPSTVKVHFSPIGGAGSGKETDTRIMSKDKINMEVSVAVVYYMKNSPATDDKNTEKFKNNAKEYFENYRGFWADRYKEPFRATVRTLLGAENYASAKDKRRELSGKLQEWLSFELKNTPLGIVSVNISNINPPSRMLAEQELLKATEIANQRQSIELKLQASKKDVLAQEATNLKNALKIAPKLLEWRKITIRDKYADSFNNVVTGEEAKSIQKVIFMPYGTPVVANK